MNTLKTRLVRELTGPLIPYYVQDIRDLEGAVAVVATPFNCYLRGDDPDLSNSAIAHLAGHYMELFGLPFIGQWEQANILENSGLCRTTVMPTENGERVESQRLTKFLAQHLPAGAKIIRVGMPEHLGRCVALDHYVGLNPVVPSGCAQVPYDNRVNRPGAQRWCTTRTRFVQYERFLARPGTIGKCLLGKF